MTFIDKNIYDVYNNSLRGIVVSVCRRCKRIARKMTARLHGEKHMTQCLCLVSRNRMRGLGFETEMSVFWTTASLRLARQMTERLERAQYGEQIQERAWYR